MKNFGSVSEYSELRTADLLKAYFAYIESVDYIRMADVFNHIASLPAPRFYVSAARSLVVINRIENGDALLDMRRNKREMFQELHRRYVAIRKYYPNITANDAINTVLEQPAPSFYLSPISAKIIILKARKVWFQKKQQRLSRFQ